MELPGLVQAGGTVTVVQDQKDFNIDDIDTRFLGKLYGSGFYNVKNNNRGYTIINRRLYSAANQNGNKEILIESGQQRRHGDCFQAKRQGWSSWGLHAGTEQNVRNLKRPLPA